MVALAACSSSSSSSSPASVGDSDGGADAATADASTDLGAQRAACTFTTGARVADTLGVGPAKRAALPIKNIIVLMKENRSFDHVLGMLHDRGQPDTESIPATFTNRDTKGATVAPFHEPTTCVSRDPDHQWISMHAQVNGGKMDGFVQSAAYTTGTDGHFVMGYYDESDLPFDYFLAKTFALEDRHFPSVRSGTFPNRNFLLLGTADGVNATGAGFPKPTTPTLFDALDKAGVTWGVYSDGSLLSGTLDWKPSHKGAHPFGDALTQLDDGSLPQVVFIDGIDNAEDEHPTADMQRGERWTKKIYDHAIASKLWPGIALIWTYDEAGGFADHVPPPNSACVARPVPEDAAFTELGTRVPLVVVSPWAKPHHVSHEIEDHTAITRFIELVFDLPAMTARDANSGALLDLFDFATPALMSPPTAPAPGTGGCTSGVQLATNKPVYASGESIVVSFTGAPGTRPLDSIAVYPYTAQGPTQPHMGSIVWQYVGGTHTGTTSPTMGQITLDASAVDQGPWPLPKGGYIAYYLVAGSYSSLASIDFNVQ